MNSIIQDRLGNVFIARNIDNINGFSTATSDIKKTGQNYIAKNKMKVEAIFTRYYNYANDQIAFLTNNLTGPSPFTDRRFIVLYDYTNDTYISSTELSGTPFAEIKSRGFFFINGNIFVPVLQSIFPGEWVIKKYSFPEFSLLATTGTIDTLGTFSVELNSTHIFVLRKTGGFEWKIARYDDNLSLELESVSSVGSATSVSADNSFSYVVKNSNQMYQGTLNFTGFALKFIFVTGWSHSIADNNFHYIQQPTGGTTALVKHNSVGNPLGGVSNIFVNGAFQLAGAAVTANHVAIVDSNKTIQIYDKAMNYERTLS